MKEYLTFDDVLILPKFSDIESRKEVDLSLNVKGLPFLNLPIISSNMDTVTGPEMAIAMAKAGAIGCVHRFYGDFVENISAFFKSTYQNGNERKIPMVSVGVGHSELERAEALFEAGARTFIIDVAHGAQMSVVRQAQNLREIIKGNGAIIVGNFSTGETVANFLDRFNGVDGFKVGIGPGSACTTRLKTGVGLPQLATITEISQVLDKTNLVIIADGGMKKPGDIAKALGAGAHMVMLGGMLAGTTESPSEIITDASGLLYKKYRGSASQESYEAQGKVGSHRTAEGEAFLVPYKGSVVNILQDIEGGLRSAFTYVGARNLSQFQAKVEFIRISASSVKEGSAHGKS